MCGIFLCLLNKAKFNLKYYESLFEQLSRRGPNFSRLIENCELSDYGACLFSSVLNVRGDHLVEQPIVQGDDFLQFNGELYQIVNDLEFDKIVQNDGLYLVNRLVNCTDEQSVFDVISELRGEFSFVYWSAKLQTIFFGRDFFGRRSLCWNIDSKFYLRNSSDRTKLDETIEFSHQSVGLRLADLEHNFCISSIAYYDDRGTCWTEIPANGIFKLSFNRHDDDFEQIKLVEWRLPGAQLAHPKIPLLHSPIINSFNFELPDQINDEEMLNYELDFLTLLKKSVQQRVLKQNFVCRICSSTQLTCNHSCLAVLFSGGLDSTILALIANEFMKKDSSIDLINLAFSNKAPDRQTGWSSYLELKKLAPDRKWNFVVVDKTSDQLIEEREKVIKRIIYPLNTVLDDSIGCAIYFASKAEGRLIQDDLGKLSKFQSLEQLDLVNASPENVNDLINQYPSIPYESSSKILLSGQGADEQLAGYGRHRVTFKMGGWTALQKEINLDVNRISYRNLGRDDRMAASNGRESRYPFLDEHLVNFLNSLPTNVKCDLSLPRGEGDKRLLRLIAERLGLEKCYRYEKRAIQFGSKIAKLENKKEKAHIISDRLA